MIKTLNSKSAYKVVNGSHIYLVILTRLKNTYEGNPRFEAQVIHILDNNIPDYLNVRTFRFKGHYYNDYQEANYLIDNMYK